MMLTSHKNWSKSQLFFDQYRLRMNKKGEKRNTYVMVPFFDITQTDCPPEGYPKLYPNKPENFTLWKKKWILKSTWTR